MAAATFEGRLVSVPDRYFGPAQVGMMVVPREMLLHGDLIAFDPQGLELDRSLVTVIPCVCTHRGGTHFLDNRACFVNTCDCATYRPDFDAAHDQ